MENTLTYMMESFNTTTPTPSKKETPEPKDFTTATELGLHVENLLFACGEKTTRETLKQIRRDVLTFANEHPEQLNAYVEESRYQRRYPLPEYFAILAKDVEQVNANSKTPLYPTSTPYKLEVVAREVRQRSTEQQR